MELKNIETALVHDYLISLDPSLGKVFGVKFKAVSLITE